jgi:NAD(P)-dependent dehydrogenase (short-subunit alcohol dehydrogenase family)
MHSEAFLEHGGSVVIADFDLQKAKSVVKKLRKTYDTDKVHASFIDVLDLQSIEKVVAKYPEINILINNAAKNPKVAKGQKVGSDFESMSLDQWRDGMDTTLDGAFLCSQVLCKKFLNDGFGVVLNISSDLGVIAPDQRIYDNGKKPITYSVSKFGLVGMTKYLATYYADKNIRVNSISPGGVYNGQPKEFVDRLTNLIPMGRMANRDEYKGAIVFLCSDASTYMTGENIVMNGGRAAW